MSGRRVMVIPWRSTPDRQPLLDFVLDWYAPLGLPAFASDSGQQPFNRGASRNLAALAAGDWDVALFNDADCVAELPMVEEAFRIAEETGKAVFPSNDFWALTKGATKTILAHPEQARTRAGVEQAMGYFVRLKDSIMPSGTIVVPRAAWDAVGGYEEGFVGWGWEDTAFLHDLRRHDRMATVAPGGSRDLRLPGRMLHLWHDRGGLRIERGEVFEQNARLRGEKHPVVGY